MTTEQAIEIFWKAYEDYPKRAIAGRDKVKQSDLYRAGFEALLSEIDKEWAERYLAMEQTKRALEYQFDEGSWKNARPGT